MIKRFIFPLFLLLTVVNIFLSSWYVLHNDISFISDVSRDMFLLKELDQKKFVLIGPRSSVGGLFHGPLWTYLNYLPFKLGHGNPITVGWYWIFLICVFLFFSYHIAKRLFDTNTAMLYVLIMSMYFIYHANELFNPYGAMFLLPAFFYFFIRYLENKKIRYLVYHIFVAGGMIQFQMAIGMPLTILSLLYITVFCIFNKKISHLLTFFLLLIPLSTFIIFDMRHEFILVKNIIRHMGTFDSQTTMFDLLKDRLQTLFTKIEFLRYGPDNGQLYSNVLLFIFSFTQIIKKTNRKSTLAFLYFYLGFFLLSFLNRYRLLIFYYYPLISLVFLIFSSFITSKYEKIFLCIFVFMYICNMIGAYKYVSDAQKFIGISKSSWKSLYEVASSVYKGEEKELGYFVYAPDIMGYSPRYALEYASTIFHKTATAFERKPVTYLVIEPPAENNPFTSETIWKISQIHFYATPAETHTFPNGYKVEKYYLENSELSVPFDPGVNPGLHYR